MKITVVVDMQNDFISGVLGSKAARRIVPKVAEEIAKGGSCLYVCTMDTHGSSERLMRDSPDSLEHLRLPDHCVEGTPGAEIEPRIASAIRRCGAAAVYSHKNTFADMQYLARDILKFLPASPGKDDLIEIYGLCTDICVISNALLLRSCFPDVPIVVRSGLCAGTSAKAHRAALTVMKSCLIDVTD